MEESVANSTDQNRAAPANDSVAASADLSLEAPAHGSTASTADQRRVVLVISNATYRQLGDQLKSPANDAIAIAARLRSFGVTVIETVDLDRQGMNDAIRRFDRAMQRAGAGIFYYAAHVMEYKGQNYLFPTDAVMETSVPTRLVFLDACGNTPLASRFRSTPGPARSASLRRGLGRIAASFGAFIAYATAPGDIAADGKRDNSPFTEAMLTHLVEPGLEISLLMHKVRNKVIRATYEAQFPWVSSSLPGLSLLIRAA